MRTRDIFYSFFNIISLLVNLQNCKQTNAHALTQTQAILFNLIKFVLRLYFVYVDYSSECSKLFPTQKRDRTKHEMLRIQTFNVLSFNVLLIQAECWSGMYCAYATHAANTHTHIRRHGELRQEMCLPYGVRCVRFVALVCNMKNDKQQKAT